MSVESIIQQVPDEFKNIYRKHWNTIKERITKGRLKDVYHYPLVTTNNDEITTKLHNTISEYHDKIKINVAFGFILQKRSTDELKFFHPSNNTMLFELPRLIQSPTDYNNLISDIDQQDAFDYAQKQRPSTNWIVIRIMCVRFDIFRII